MRSIMVVDDDEWNLTLLRRAIASTGTVERLYAYTDSQQACRELEHLEVDALITDIEMPVINGLELAGKLLDKQPQAKVVFITAYHYYALEAFELYAMDYILKPFQPERLKRTMARMQEQYRDKKPTDRRQELTVRTFGKLEVRKGAEHIRWQGPKTEELFAFLLNHYDQFVHKDMILEYLWPDYEYRRGLRNMQTAMCRVRQSFYELGVSLSIEYSCNSYRLRFEEPVSMDLLEFERCASALISDPEDNAREAARVMSLYTGDYLEQHGFLWALARQESLKRMYRELERKCRAYTWGRPLPQSRLS